MHFLTNYAQIIINVEEYETDVQIQDQGEGDEEHEGEDEGNPEAKDIFKYDRYYL